MDAPGRLTPREAYQAMFKFLEAYWERTNADGTGPLLAEVLSDVALAKDGRPMDPAMWGDWKAALEHVRRGSSAP